METDNFIVVTPVYEDADVAQRLFYEINKEFGEKAYIVAVDDGSLSSVVNTEAISKVGLKGVVIKLKRNVGHQKAIAIGLSYVSENLSDQRHVVVMDSDGEDIPSSISFLIEELNKKDGDVAVASRKSRVETLKFRAFYLLYKSVFKLLSGRVINFGNFMALKASAVNRLVTMPELWTHVAGSVLLSKLRVSYCSLDRGPRFAGQSKMNFVSLVLHGFRGLMVFAEDVLVRVGIACIVVAFVSVVGGVLAILLKTFGFATPGWFSIVMGILILVFLQTAVLTLISLMLTGSMKGAPTPVVDYKKLIEVAERVD